MRGVRQHVNPLALHYQCERAEPLTRPDRLPSQARVEVELGCADAQFAFALARAHPDRFVVGLDIREALVRRNRERAAREGLDNLAFGYVNLNVDLGRVFARASVDRFHLLFPDPWFKRRHVKRRVLDLDLCRTLRAQLRSRGELHLATDVFDVALDAMATLESEAALALGFVNVRGAWTFDPDPPPITSRRDDTTRARAERVWRLRYGVGASSSSVGR